MIASPTKLFVVHVPKTAGSSLFHILKQHFGEANTCPLRYGDLHLLPRREINEGYSLYFAHAHYSHLSLIDGPVFAATYLRDPVVRFLSYLDFLRRDERPDAVNVLLRKHSNREIIGEPEFRDIALALANDVTIRFSQTGFEPPPLQYPYDDCLETARKNLGRLDFIGFSEAFVSSTERLFEAMSIVPGGDFNVQLNEGNTSDGAGLDADLIDELEDICRYDIALYEEQLKIYNKTYLGFSFRTKPAFGPLIYSKNVPVIQNNPDRPGVVAFGPYVSLPRGTYEVRYVVQYCAMASSEDLSRSGTLRFEVCNDLGRMIFASDEMKLAPGEALNEVVVTLQFSLRVAVQSVEFRSFASRGLSVRQNADVVVTRRAGWKKAVPANARTVVPIAKAEEHVPVGETGVARLQTSSLPRTGR